MVPGTEIARAQRSHSPPVTGSPASSRSMRSESADGSVPGVPGPASGGLSHGKVLAIESMGARREPSGRPSTRS
ncbi:hypothetical protein CXG46_04505 [Nocardioides alpinus]|uniref:Uncharacterized protein n=1 Tax=Nocardioides alpinus TaxID=748909 RepID=A0ABX4R101_9ACTN|nr:hypothetical protein CXG46_04505 [Nocardioides alpinus]